VGLAITGGLVAAVGLGALFVFGGNPVATPVSLGPGGPNAPGIPADVDPAPRVVTVIVELTTAGAPIAAGNQCAFAIEPTPHPSLGYWCHTTIDCGGRVLYGGGEAGYFPCRLEPRPRVDLVGSDAETSTRDSDAAFEIDTRTGVMTLRDDARGRFGAYELRARVLSVR
jgi:hypothetical protein